MDSRIGSSSLSHLATVFFVTPILWAIVSCVRPRRLRIVLKVFPFMGKYTRRIHYPVNLHFGLGMPQDQLA